MCLELVRLFADEQKKKGHLENEYLERCVTNMSENIYTDFEALIKNLNNKEKHYRKVRDDIFDMDESDETDAIDQEAKIYIRRIKKWKQEIETIKSEIINDNLFVEDISALDNEKSFDIGTLKVAENITEEMTTLQNIKDDYQVAEKLILVDYENEIDEQQSDEEIKIGQYVRETLRELGNKGLVFLNNEIEIMSGKGWSI